MRAGLSQHGALACIVSLAVAYIALNLALLQVMANTFVFFIDVLVYVVFNLILNRLVRLKEAACGRC